MDLSKSCLAIMNTKINHKIKGKIPYLWLRCWIWNEGKWMLLTVSDKTDSNFSMVTQEGWNLVKYYIGRLNIMPVLGEMVRECNRLHHALSSNWWKLASPNVHGFPYLCMPLWVDQTPSWNNPFHRHKRLKLPHGYNCEVDICCSSGCEVRLWRTQVCTLSKEIRD